MNKYKINEKIFFVPISGKMVLWNNNTHKQYDLNFEYLSVIYEIIERGYVNNLDDQGKKIIDVLLKENIIFEDYIQIKDNFTQEGKAWKILREIFYEGTKLASDNYLSEPISDEEYVDYCESIIGDQGDFYYQKFNASDAIELPVIQLDEKDESIQYLLFERRTCRNFYARKKMDINIFSSILRISFGYLDIDSVDHASGIETFGFKRTSPAGGGLQAVEIYLYVRQVEGINEGIYYYNPKLHSLHRINSNIPVNDDFHKVFLGQSFMNECCFYALYVINFSLLDWKYPTSRSTRAAIMDVGHLSQTFHLVSNSYKVKTCMTGAFYDDVLSSLLNLGNDCWPMFATGAGYGNGSAISKIKESYVKGKKGNN